MKIVIYGRGNKFKQLYNQIPWNNIVAIIDQTARENEFVNQIPVLQPKDIIDLEFDYISIFVQSQYEEIAEILQYVYFIPVNKIMSWKFLIEEKNKFFQETMRFLRDYITCNQISLIADTLDSPLDRYLLSKSFFEQEKSLIIDKYNISKDSSLDFFYDNSFSMEDCIKNNYDLVLMWEINEQLLNKFENCKNIFIFEAYSAGKKDRCPNVELLNKFKITKEYSNVEGTIWIKNRKDDEQSNKVINIAIYVVIHKKYNVYTNEIYIPICVGSQYKNPQFLSDSSGDNISYLNEKINECTALYWIWKNTTEEIVGLNHYRRYFYNNGIKRRFNILSYSKIQEYLKEYDIILAESVPFYEITVEEQLRRTIPDREICDLSLKLCEEILMQKHPQYIKAYKEVMQGHNFFRCNIFVTRRKILNRYCEWLFSFLIELANRVDVSMTDKYSKRIVGFIAERMMTVWLRKNKLKIKELPYTNT